MCAACLVGLCDRCRAPCICRERDHPVLAVRLYWYGPDPLAVFAATVSNATGTGEPVWSNRAIASPN
jgi:hypothetical protein